MRRPSQKPAAVVVKVAVALVLAPIVPASARRPPSESREAGSPVVRAAAPPAEGSPAERLLAAADDVTRQVVALRGLEPRRPIARGVLSREQIGKKLTDRIAKEYTPDEIRVESRLLKRLGLLPPDVDYQALLVGLLQEQVAGFYDPFVGQLYIADWLGLDLQRPALAHEIEHALQDQHFDLKAFASPIKDDGDRQLARSALVEGDGTAVMLEFVAQANGFDPATLTESGIAKLGKQISAGSMEQSPIYARAPRFLRETLLFPYFAGMQFVYALRRGRTWSRVNEAFRSPPDSTEQVMHPEKYLAREKPIAIAAGPVASLSGCAELRRDVLGELEMKVLFMSRLTEPEAERAAAGWGGDRLVVYGPAGVAEQPVVVVDLSTWDSEEDARQAEAAMRTLVPALAGKPVAGPLVVERDGEAWMVERRGRELLAIFGAPVDTRAALADEVWKGWKVSEPPGKRDRAEGGERAERRRRARK